MKITRKNKLSRKNNGLINKYNSMSKFIRYKKLTILQNAGGLFDYFKLKKRVNDVNKIFGMLNTLEKKINNELDSYTVQMKTFEGVAKRAAEKITEYILEYRSFIILKIYRKDKEELKTQENSYRIRGIETEIELHKTKAEAALVAYETIATDLARYLPAFVRAANKIQSESEDFNKINVLRSKLAPYQEQIRTMREKAHIAETMSKDKLSSADRAVITKYRKHKDDYDRILDFNDQNLQTVRELMIKISEMVSTANFYKNQ